MSKIILKNVGRNNINKTIEVKHDFNEEDLAEITYKEVQKHCMSRSSLVLEPDEEKGDGFWKVYAGFYHVGDVEIIK